MRVAHVILLAGFVTMLAPSLSVGAQENRLREDRVRAAVRAHAEARATCAIVVLEPAPTDERFVLRPPADVTPAIRTVEPRCEPSHVIPAPHASAGRPAPTPATPPFAMPAAPFGARPTPPLANGLAGVLEPR